MGCVTRTNWLDFGDDPALDADTEILCCFGIALVKSANFGDSQRSCKQIVTKYFCGVGCLASNKPFYVVLH